MPARGRGCEEPILDSEQFTFTLASNPPRTFHVRAFEAFPLAFPLQSDDSCEGLCSLFANDSIADVRRGRDLALIYLARDSEQYEPGYYVKPLRVLTQTEQGSDVTGGPAYLDIDSDFRVGSKLFAGVVAFGSKPDAPGPVQCEGVGHFDLGPFWNIGCDQVVHCERGENRRNRCPPIPFATSADFYQDNVLRLLDVDNQPWLASFTSGASGAALLLKGTPGKLSTLSTEDDTLIGVLSDTETSAAGRPSDRPAAYFAPTFAADVGGWLARRISDFDSDCAPDNSDNAPTQPNPPSTCWDDPAKLKEAGWTRVLLESQLAAPTPSTLSWPARGSVAAATRDALSLDLFVVSGDGTLYRSRAVPETDWNQLNWSPWAPIALDAQLRGELSAVALGNDVSLCGLTGEQQLRCFVVNAVGEASEEAAPSPDKSGFFSSGPAAVLAPFATAGGIDLFIRSGDGKLLRYKQREGSWDEPAALLEPGESNEVVITSAPVATSTGNKLEIFARSSGFDLVHWTIDSEADPRFSEKVGAMTGVPAVYSANADRVEVLSRDGTGALLQLIRERDASSWNPVGIHLLTNPVPVVPAAGYVQLFALSEPNKFLTLMHHE